jgi:hypothetical protein
MTPLSSFFDKARRVTGLPLWVLAIFGVKLAINIVESAYDAWQADAVAARAYLAWSIFDFLALVAFVMAVSRAGVDKRLHRGWLSATLLALSLSTLGAVWYDPDPSTLLIHPFGQGAVLALAAVLAAMAAKAGFEQWLKHTTPAS